jgi:hypothetical protein
MHVGEQHARLEAVLFGQAAPVPLDRGRAVDQNPAAAITLAELLTSRGA